MIAQTGQYALRILAYLVEHEGERVQGHRIADDTGIPRNYLSKILNQLCKGGWVSSQRGWGGGFMLLARAHRVPIRRVLERIEGPRGISDCFFGQKHCDRTEPCPLHESWGLIHTTYSKMLGTVTIADLGGGRGA